MNAIFDQPFLAIVLFAMIAFALALGFVSLTDRDPRLVEPAE